MMFKKSISSLLAISLISIGGTAAFADTATVSQSQNSTSPYNLLQMQQKNSTISKYQMGPVQATSGYATGSQVQSQSTNDPAALSQSNQTKLKMNDQESTGGKTLTQSVTAKKSLDQSTTVSNPSQVVQGTVGSTAGIQLQASIPGGPTIQHQQIQQTTVQYNLAVDKVAPASGSTVR